MYRFLCSMAVVAIVAAVPAPVSAAASTMYDMNIFLSQPYPLDLGPAVTPPPETTPVPDAGVPETLPVDEIEGVDEEIDEGANDPLEPVNRFFFGLNEALRIAFFRPISRLYNNYVPTPVHDAASNFLDNLSSPVTLANDILQLEPRRAWRTTERMVVNSTIGLGGIFDVADSWLNIPEHKEDFGQTLGSWGVGEGFYLVLPLLGPSNPRDAVGDFLVDGYFDPVGLWLSNTDRDELIYSRTGVGGLVRYSSISDDLDSVKTTSIDFYAAIRSMYRQKRKSEIDNGEHTFQLPDVDLDSNLEYDIEDDEEIPSAAGTGSNQTSLLPN